MPHYLNFTHSEPIDIYTLSLHDALPTSRPDLAPAGAFRSRTPSGSSSSASGSVARRSEEHTSELQSHSDLVCRLLLEKKNSMTSSHMVDTANALLLRDACYIILPKIDAS